MNKICAVDGCSKPAEKRGWCGAHYYRWRMHGHPMAGRVKNGAMSSFLLAFKPDSTNQCIPWPFTVSENGYGLRVTINEKVYYPHQFVCESFHGEKPSLRHEVAHYCGTRICINPKHLRWAKHIENVADQKRHGTMIKGERVYGAKLTADKVREIRSSKESNDYLAKKFSVTAHTIRDVRARRTWRHLP